MFIGPEGSGKLQMAISMAQYMLCENPSKTDSCGECAQCKQCAALTHPDLHFAFPVVLSKKEHVESSDDRRTEWNKLLLKKRYFNLNQWQIELDELGKNAVIGKEESRSIMKKLSLKSFSGRYKFMIVWLPEKMNLTAANKLLKLLEEPPEGTYFFLVSNSTESILPTIISRTQFIRIPALQAEESVKFLKKNYGIDEQLAVSVIGFSQRNINEAIHLVEGDNSYHVYFDLFVKMMRAAYTANPMDLMDITDQITDLEKERQKNFIKYALHILRESIMLNYMKGQLVHLREEEKQFLSKFARFINNRNITELMDEFNSGFYQLERNANPKILFSDLLIKLTKLIKRGV
jgi:DNA polymerase-3 subunit delta'